MYIPEGNKNNTARKHANIPPLFPINKNSWPPRALNFLKLHTSHTSPLATSYLLF